MGKSDLKLDKLEYLAKYEKHFFKSSDTPIRQRAELFANYMGRRVLVGRAVGIIRFAAATILSVLCAVGALLSLALSGVTRPFNRSVSDTFFGFAALGGLYTLNGIFQAGRGLLEAIPIVGYWIYVNHDYQNYQNHHYIHGIRGNA